MAHLKCGASLPNERQLRGVGGQFCSPRRTVVKSGAYFVFFFLELYKNVCQASTCVLLLLLKLLANLLLILVEAELDTSWTQPHI